VWFDQLFVQLLLILLQLFVMTQLQLLARLGLL